MQIVVYEEEQRNTVTGTTGFSSTYCCDDATTGKLACTHACTRFGFFTTQGKVAAAQEALDQALGLDFGIRESAAYAATKAQLLLAEGQPADAERLLQAAMNMPGVKRALPAATM